MPGEGRLREPRERVPPYDVPGVLERVAHREGRPAAGEVEPFVRNPEGVRSEQDVIAGATDDIVERAGLAADPEVEVRGPDDREVRAAEEVVLHPIGGGGIELREDGELPRRVADDERRRGVELRDRGRAVGIRPDVQLEEIVVQAREQPRDRAGGPYCEGSLGEPPTATYGLPVVPRPTSDEPETDRLARSVLL